MKKTFFIGVIFILVGVIIGSNFRKFNYSSVNAITKKDNSFYFLQEGVYAKKENVEKNTKNLDQKLIIYNDKKYYVYLGITKDKKIADKLKEIYEKRGLNLYEKVQTINNEKLNNNITQFDLLINNSNSEEEILTIEEVVLASYDEIVNN